MPLALTSPEFVSVPSVMLSPPLSASVEPDPTVIAPPVLMTVVPASASRLLLIAFSALVLVSVSLVIELSPMMSISPALPVSYTHLTLPTNREV